MVWNLVAKYVPGQHDREDLFQEVFLRVHQALSRFRNDSAITTWLYRISVNTALNFLKKKERYAKLQQLLIWTGFTEAREEETGDEGILFEPLSKLNAQQRTIILLSDVEERKLEEIAQMLKLPLGTVKSNLFRAREIIRKELVGNGRLQ